MAKGNLILGTMSGKLGDVVTYTNNGKQCARVRRRVVANPNSAGQQVQRMILSTAAQAVSKLRPILNNAFEGIQKGAPSLAYARKLYMRMLRTEGMWNTDNGLRYVMKGGNYLAPNGFIVSRGSLTAPVLRAGGPADEGVFLIEHTTPTATATLTQVFPWAAPGMQFTFVWGRINTGLNDVPVSEIHFASCVFKDDTTPAFVADGEDWRINAQALDANFTQGDITAVSLTAGGYLRLDSANGEETAFAALIYSTKDGSKRSNATLIVKADILPNLTFAPDQVVETYDNSGVDTGAPAEYYLDNNPGGSF